MLVEGPARSSLTVHRSEPWPCATCFVPAGSSPSVDRAGAERGKGRSVRGTAAQGRPFFPCSTHHKRMGVRAGWQARCGGGRGSRVAHTSVHHLACKGGVWGGVTGARRGEGGPERAGGELRHPIYPPQPLPLCQSLIRRRRGAVHVATTLALPPLGTLSPALLLLGLGSCAKARRWEGS